MTVLIGVKTSNTSRTSTETEVLDPHLQVTVSTSTVYTFKAFLICTHSGGGGGDIRMQWSLPTGAGGACTFMISDETCLFADPIGAATVFLDIPTSSTGRTIICTGRLQTFGNGGTFGLSWAQSNSNANSSIIAENSWIKLTEL